MVVIRFTRSDVAYYLKENGFKGNKANVNKVLEEIENDAKFSTESIVEDVIGFIAEELEGGEEDGPP